MVRIICSSFVEYVFPLLSWAVKAHPMQKKVGLFRSTLQKNSPYARKSRTFCSKVDHLTNSECQVSRTFDGKKSQDFSN